MFTLLSPASSRQRPLHSARSMKKWFSEFSAEESGRQRAQTSTPVNTFRDELECWLWAGPYRPTSVTSHTNAVVAEWEKIPAAGLQILLKRSGKGFNRSIWMVWALGLQLSHLCIMCNDKLYTYFWPLLFEVPRKDVQIFFSDFNFFFLLIIGIFALFFFCSAIIHTGEAGGHVKLPSLSLFLKHDEFKKCFRKMA